MRLQLSAPGRERGAGTGRRPASSCCCPSHRRPGPRDAVPTVGAGAAASRGDRPRRHVQARVPRNADRLRKRGTTWTSNSGCQGTIMPPTDQAIANALAQRSGRLRRRLVAGPPDGLASRLACGPRTSRRSPSLQANPHVHIDPLVMMAAAGAQMTRAKVGVVVTDVLTRRQPGRARADDAHTGPSDARPRDPGAGVGGAAEHRAVRHAVRQAGRAAVRGHRHPAHALGCRRPGQLRGALPPARERRARNVALRFRQPAHLDRSARPTHARPDWAEVRRLAADEDDRRGVRRIARRRSGAARKRPVARWAR